MSNASSGLFGKDERVVRVPPNGPLQRYSCNSLSAERRELVVGLLHVHVHLDDVRRVDDALDESLVVLRLAHPSNRSGDAYRAEDAAVAVSDRGPDRLESLYLLLVVQRVPPVAYQFEFLS